MRFGSTSKVLAEGKVVRHSADIDAQEGDSLVLSHLVPGTMVLPPFSVSVQAAT